MILHPIVRLQYLRSSASSAVNSSGFCLCALRAFAVKFLFSLFAFFPIFLLCFFCLFPSPPLDRTCHNPLEGLSSCSWSSFDLTTVKQRSEPSIISLAGTPSKPGRAET